jgi:hypothetical protein
LRRARRGEVHHCLAADFPVLHTALQIYRETERGPRWALEACVMTGTPAAEIAATFGLGSAVMKSYEALCFDIRDRLECGDLLFRRLLNRPVSGSDGFRHLGWKRIAYFGGAAALSDLFSLERETGFQDVVRSNSRATRLATVFQLRRLVESVYLPPRVLREVSKVVDYLGDGSDDKGDEYCKQVWKLLQGIEVSVLSKKEVEENPEFHCQIEMRAAETFLAALGLPPPHDELKDGEKAPNLQNRPTKPLNEQGAVRYAQAPASN